MRGLTRLYRLTVGKKYVVAVSGWILLAFVVGHLFGNLKIFLGPAVYNHYAEGLRVLGAPLFANQQLLWIARIGLLVALIAHVYTVVQLVLDTRRARQTEYQQPIKWQVLSPASMYMFSGGLTILAFVIYHVAHLTFGVGHPQFAHLTDPETGMVYANAYNNVVFGFQRPLVALIYILAQFPLAVHIYHGVWSSFQTLGFANLQIKHWRRPIAVGIALVILLGNLSIPVAVMLGLLAPAAAGAH